MTAAGTCFTTVSGLGPPPAAQPNGAAGGPAVGRDLGQAGPGPGSQHSRFAGLRGGGSPSTATQRSDEAVVSRHGGLSFSLSRARKKSARVTPAFAHLSTSVKQQKREARLRSTFNEISQDKGCFDEADLTLYAVNNGLPTNYVKSFISAVDKSGGFSFGFRPAGCIGYQKFSTYVTSREEALKQTFQALDVKGDGTIDPEELEIGLSHIRVKCPESKCVYKCKKEAVHDFVETVAKGKGSSFKYSEFRDFFLLLPQDDMMFDYFMSSKDSSPCDIGGCVVLHKKTGGNPMGHLLAGAMSGAVSRTVTAPLETLRLMAMTGTMPEGGTIKAAQTVMQSNGWQALFKGNGVNVMRSAPQKALDFFAFDGYKTVLSRLQARNGNAETTAQGPTAQMGLVGTLVAAGLAGATSSTLLYPLEVLRSRITIDSTGAYAGVVDAFRKIIAKEGPAALYSGLGPSVAAIVPEAAITYGMFDVLKRSYSQMMGLTEPGVVVSLGFGVTSAFMGQLVAYPLETVSRRMQVQQGPRQDVRAVIAHILKTEGIGGFYGGVRAALLKVLPMAVFSFGTYELVRAYLNDLGDKAEVAQVNRECSTRTCNKTGKAAEMYQC